MAIKDDNVFLSYRRNDSADVIGRIYDRLTQTYGKQAIFKDVDSMPLGIDFRTHLAQVINVCSVFIAVIGPRWGNAIDAEGNCRLKQPEDFVRIEVESALARDIPVIPLLVSGALMPTVDQLPPSLQNLAYRNGTPVRPDPDFHNDMDRVIAGLAIHLPQRTALTADKSDSPVPPISAPPPILDETPSSGINITAGGAIGSISGIVGGNVSGVVNLGTISGTVTNGIHQLPDAATSKQPGLKELLLKLQAAIEAEPGLDSEDKAEALEQVQIFAEAGQNPEVSSMQKASKTALKVLRGTIALLPTHTKLTQECDTLLPAIANLLTS